jgi:hypothetical protein
LTRFLQASISRGIHREGRTALRTSNGQTHNEEAMKVKSGPPNEGCQDIDEVNKRQNKKDCNEETAKSRSSWCDLSQDVRF